VRQVGYLQENNKRLEMMWTGAALLANNKL
jgi:hypothetical protein